MQTIEEHLASLVRETVRDVDRRAGLCPSPIQRHRSGRTGSVHYEILIPVFPTVSASEATF